MARDKRGHVRTPLQEATTDYARSLRDTKNAVGQFRRLISKYGLSEHYLSQLFVLETHITNAAKLQYMRDKHYINLARQQKKEVRK